MSKQSRDIGNRGELRACKILTEWGQWGHVVSARKAMTGTRRGEDLVREIGIKEYEQLETSVEVKAGEQAFTVDWIKQAMEQAGWCEDCYQLVIDGYGADECPLNPHARPWLLMWIPKFCQTGREWMIEADPRGGWSMTWFDIWKQRQ